MRAQFKPDDRQFKVCDKIRVNLHPGEIEDAVVKAVIRDADSIKLQIDVVGLDLTALIDTWQVVSSTIITLYLFFNCSTTLSDCKLEVYFERGADSPKLLGSLESESKGRNRWNEGSCLQSKCPPS